MLSRWRNSELCEQTCTFRSLYEFIGKLEARTDLLLRYVDGRIATLGTDIGRRNNRQPYPVDVRRRAAMGCE